MSAEEDRTGTRERTAPGPVTPPRAERAGGRAAVIVVGGKLKIVRKARELGLDVVYLQRPDSYTAEHAPYVDAALLVDYTDERLSVELARAVAGSFPVRHAVSLTEDGLTVAGRITDALGLPGTPASVARRCLDKELMRRHLASTGVTAGAVAAEPFDGPDGLHRFGAAHGWPVIVKPADYSASVGVLLVEGPGQVDAACRQVRDWQASDVPPFHRVGRFVQEEFVTGPEVSVETFSTGGRHVVLAVTEKLLAPEGFVELGHATPARLDPAVTAAVHRATAAALDGLGLRDGPSHTEFRLPGGVPRLIETHNRVGGDRIHDLVEATCGVDQDRLWLGSPTGLLAPLTAAPPVTRAAATRFITAEPGTVVAVEGLDAVRLHPAVLAADLTVAVGDQVRELRTSWDRLGQVVVTAPTTDEAVALAADLAARVHVVTR